jgi:hypothetical protein
MAFCVRVSILLILYILLRSVRSNAVVVLSALSSGRGYEQGNRAGR